MSEIFFYHLVPQDFQGKNIMPLNDMKQGMSDLFLDKSQKYNGREWILNRKIDVLDCLWNDVVHMCAVDPAVLKSTMREQGLIKVSRTKQKYFKIPLSKLNMDKLCIFYINEESYDLVDVITDENVKDLRGTIEPYETFELFDISKNAFYGTINILTKKYFNFVSRSANKNFMPYQFVPHVLYKGDIDIRGLGIVEL
jgi:hypothetical protein